MKILSNIEVGIKNIAIRKKFYYIVKIKGPSDIILNQFRPLLVKCLFNVIFYLASAMWDAVNIELFSSPQNFFLNLP